MELLIKLLLTISDPMPVYAGPHPCTLDRSSLSLQARIDMSIGCSSIRGKSSVYRRGAIEKIYEEGKVSK